MMKSALLAFAAAAALVAPAAQASPVYWSVNVGVPGVWAGVAAPPPVVVAPPPRVVYYPGYAPVYRPVYRPVYGYPGPWAHPWHRGGDRDDWHDRDDWRRHDHWDHDR